MAKTLCSLFTYLPKRHMNKLGFTKTLPNVCSCLCCFLMIQDYILNCKIVFLKTGSRNMWYVQIKKILDSVPDTLSVTWYSFILIIKFTYYFKDKNVFHFYIIFWSQFNSNHSPLWTSFKISALYLDSRNLWKKNPCHLSLHFPFHSLHGLFFVDL